MSRHPNRRSEKELFPRTLYTHPADVEHARAQYRKAIAYLRTQSKTGPLIDRHVQKVTPCAN